MSPPSAATADVVTCPPLRALKRLAGVDRDAARVARAGAERADRAAVRDQHLLLRRRSRSSRPAPSPSVSVVMLPPSPTISSPTPVRTTSPAFAADVAARADLAVLDADEFAAADRDRARVPQARGVLTEIDTVRAADLEAGSPLDLDVASRHRWRRCPRPAVPVCAEIDLAPSVTITTGAHDANRCRRHAAGRAS